MGVWVGLGLGRRLPAPAQAASWMGSHEGARGWRSRATTSAAAASTVVTWLGLELGLGLGLGLRGRVRARVASRVRAMVGF